MKEEERHVIQYCTEILRQILSGQVISMPPDNNRLIENPDFFELLSYVQELRTQYTDNYRFILDLAKGNLESYPPPRNSFANPFKQLHSELQHLTWQIKEISQGNYEQRVSFSGDFSEAMNKMVASLKANEKAEEALRDSELRFRWLFNNIPVPIAFIKTDGSLGDLNRRFEKVTGYTLQEINSFEHWWELALPDPEYRRSALEHWKLSIDKAIEKNSDIDSHEYKVICKNGVKRIFEISGIILWDGFLLCLFDITERKRIQNELKKLLKELNNSKELVESALVEKNKLLEELSVSEKKLKETIATKDKFFSIIAHDLKNPFIGLMGLSELLLEETQSNANKSTESIAKFIKEASNNGYQLLINLLEWSRLQTGSIKIEIQSLLLEELVQENIRLLQPGLADKNLQISTDGFNGILMRTDRNILSTVIRNLLSNAIKYSNENGQIAIFAEKVEEKIRISIKDTGIGIKPENLEKLFRIDTNFTTKGTKEESGTGLGLILCKDFIQKLGGDISVESHYGIGTKFTFDIPLNNPQKI